MEGLLSTFPPYTAYGQPVPAAPVQDSGLAKRQGRFITPQGLNYLELCKAIISQVSPDLPPPLQRAHTRECGVQVNAKVDKAVQCSLGPKTLLCLEGDHHASSGSPKSPEVACEKAGQQVSSLRFLRPVSIYSPQPALPEASVHLLPGVRPQDPPEESLRRRLERGRIHRHRQSGRDGFLEQRYGFFHCKKCNIRWESAYVWCISGTSKVYYKQLCRKCQVGFNPYRVESILCKGCSQTCCSCEKKQRHINMKRPHRQDLCCRCKGMRLSCDATYSFKYIV
uniref:3CxxC-type domain-containing protein n=1 Tax=Mola mola TaxID=94237 RepID=A0A3Q3WP03_MOLML